MRAGAIASAIVAGVLALAACTGPIASGYFQLEAPLAVYVYDDFWEQTGEWSIGSQFTTEDDAATYAGGFVISASRRVFLRRTEPIPRRGVAVLEWEIWHTQPGPAPIYENGDTIDFRVVFDDASGGGTMPVGPAVAFKLARSDGTARSTDVLMLGSSAATDVYESESFAEPSSQATRGVLEVRFDLESVPALLDARLVVVGPDGAVTELLSASLVIPQGVPADWAIVPMIEASGIYDESAEPPLVELRAIDRFLITALEDGG